MPITLILTLLRANWKLLAIAAAVSAYSYFWYDFGVNHIQKKWDATIAQMEKEANERSAKLEITLAEQRANNAKVNAKLRRAINANNSYADCHVSPDGLFALREAIAAK